MKRREILKKLGIGALSLVGIERLAKVMASPSQSSTEVCEEEVEVACVVSTSTDEGYTLPAQCPLGHTCPTSYTCSHGRYNSCQSFVCVNVFTCNPPSGAGDFNCSSQFQGCGVVGSFRCQNTDPNDAQFNCSVRFTGCQGSGSFRCDDFDCVNTYDCGADKVCPTWPFTCQNPPHPRFSCPANYNS